MHSFDHAYGRRCSKYLCQSKARFVEESSIFSLGTLITTGHHQHLYICNFTKVGSITGWNHHFAHQELPICWHRMMNVPEEHDSTIIIKGVDHVLENICIAAIWHGF